MAKIKISKVVEDNEFIVLAGEEGLKNYVEEDMLSRPGVELAGFFDYFEPKRIVLIGSKEATFLDQLPIDIAKTRVKYLFKQNPPAIVFSKNVIIPPYFLEFANEYKVPALKSNLRTTPLNSKLYTYLQEYLAPKINVHGVLMDINGMGTLIIGKSGIGKSETALELIKRGHQLISDDRVDIFEKEIGILIGSAPPILRRFIEIRGIGIVDVVQLFGAGAYRETKKVRLVVELEKWEPEKYYDRLGLQTEKIKYFDTEISKVVIPVLPGRNLALLVESAAMNEKLKYMGYHAAKEFTNSVNKLARGEESDE